MKALTCLLLHRQAGLSTHKLSSALLGQAGMHACTTHLQMQAPRPDRAERRTPQSHSSESAGMLSSALESSCKHMQ